jgi:hypothetical protein
MPKADGFPLDRCMILIAFNPLLCERGFVVITKYQVNEDKDIILTFFGLAYQGKDIVFRFIIEYIVVAYRILALSL